MAFLLDRPPHLGGLPRFQHPNDITDFPKPLGYLYRIFHALQVYQSAFVAVYRRLDRHALVATLQSDYLAPGAKTCRDGRHHLVCKSEIIAEALWRRLQR